jgi:hypothetical protein
MRCHALSAAAASRAPYRSRARLCRGRQPPCQSRRPSHLRSKATAELAVTTVTLAGCGGSRGYHQAVRGTFVRVGGPTPRSPYPLPGTITARAATGSTFTATAGRSGRFMLSLPPGRYQVTGRSALIQSGQMICAATAELRVARHKAARPSPWFARFTRDSVAGEVGFEHHQPRISPASSPRSLNRQAIRRRQLRTVSGIAHQDEPAESGARGELCNGVAGRAQIALSVANRISPAARGCR